MCNLAEPQDTAFGYIVINHAEPYILASFKVSHPGLSLDTPLSSWILRLILPFASTTGVQ
jgi:hypothetical protein